MLVVGDSLEVGTEPYLRRELAGVELTVDALKGRPSSQGVDVLAAALRPEHEVVVFDLGTNDDPANPAGLAASLDAAAEIAGDRCMVVATINRPPLGGVDDAGLNGVVARFAASTGARVVEWKAASARPGVLGTDGVHGTADGYAVRARLVADAIRSCAASSAPAAPPRPPRPPDLVDPPPLSEPAPGLAVLARSVAAIAERAGHTLRFAAQALEALARALELPLAVGRRVIALVGAQPGGGE